VILQLVDSIEDVNRKIKKSFCPEKEIKGNPCLDYAKHIVFGKFDSFTIHRSDKNGGNKTFNSYQDLENDFVAGHLHPSDLKPALGKAINELLDPVRKHFEQDEHAKSLLAKVRNFKVTR